MAPFWLHFGSILGGLGAILGAVWVKWGARGLNLGIVLEKVVISTLYFVIVDFRTKWLTPTFGCSILGLNLGVVLEKVGADSGKASQNFKKAATLSLNRTPALFRSASQCAGVPPLAWLNFPPRVS